MQTIDQLCTELKLSNKQTEGVKAYISTLVIDLLETLKQENLKNFDETIDNLRQVNS